MPDSSKHCVICGKDCAGMPRTKDAQGKYYHNVCVEREHERKAQESQLGAADTDSMQETGIELDSMNLMNEIASDAMGGVDSQCVCDSCGYPMLAETVVCMKCGFNSQPEIALDENADGQKIRRDGESFWDRASEVLTTNFVVGMAVFVFIVSILLIILMIGG